MKITLELELTELDDGQLAALSSLIGLEVAHRDRRPEKAKRSTNPRNKPPVELASIPLQQDDPPPPPEADVAVLLRLAMEIQRKGVNIDEFALKHTGRAFSEIVSDYSERGNADRETMLKALTVA
ncbi:MAG: hypothetical protein AAGH38_12185 [Pseudomonadota bacterium]